MILTQTFYSKVSSLVAQRESQVLEETMALAQSVLKQAHRRGVELEGIQEVQDTGVMLVYLHACSLCRIFSLIFCGFVTGSMFIFFSNHRF